MPDDGFYPDSGILIYNHFKLYKLFNFYLKLFYLYEYNYYIYRII